MILKAKLFNAVDKGGNGGAARGSLNFRSDIGAVGGPLDALTTHLMAEEQPLELM